MRTTLARGIGLIVLAVAATLSLADEPAVEGTVNLAWWSNDFSADALDNSFDAGTVGVDGEIWWRRGWGLKGSLYRADVIESNSGEGPDFLSVDMKRRVISPTRNNFLALGLGWESLDLGQAGDAQGPRLLLQGGLALTPVLSVYGHTAWLPVMDGSDRMDDPSGLELEAGIAVRPFPLLSFRAGYRHFKLDFKSVEGANETSRSRGVILGAGLNF